MYRIISRAFLNAPCVLLFHIRGWNVVCVFFKHMLVFIFLGSMILGFLYSWKLRIIFQRKETNTTKRHLNYNAFYLFLFENFNLFHSFSSLFFGKPTQNQKISSNCMLALLIVAMPLCIQISAPFFTCFTNSMFFCSFVIKTHVTHF